MIQIKKSLYDYTISLFTEQKNSDSTQFVERIIWDNRETGECHFETSQEKKERYLQESIARSKRVAIDYCKNNKFNYFVTISFDSKKVDVNDIVYLRKRICKYFNNFRTRYDNNFRYIIVPEYGEKNGRIHFHGMVYQENKKFLKHLAYADYREGNLFNGLGACKWRKINHYDSRLQNYISKYITKDLLRIYKCSYFCSKGLKRSILVYSNIRTKEFNHVPNLKDRMVRSLVSWIQENNLFVHLDYVDVFTFSIEMFNSFVEEHHFLLNRKGKQLSFNDLV